MQCFRWLLYFNLWAFLRGLGAATALGGQPLLKAPVPLQDVEGEGEQYLKEAAALNGSSAAPVRKCIDLDQLDRSCNKKLKGLLDYVVDPADSDGKMKVKGVLEAKDFSLVVGLNNVKTWKLSEIKLPLETIDDTCFGVRIIHNYPHVLCTPSRPLRNVWINSIHEAILCDKTGGIEGRLPVEPGPELVAEAEGIVEEAAQSGINIHLDEDPQQGMPQLLINGNPVEVIAKEQKRETEALAQPRKPDVSVEDLLSGVDEENPRDTVVTPLRYQASPELETLRAVNESRAEKLQLPRESAPPFGFLSVERHQQQALRDVKLHAPSATSSA